MFTVTIFKKEPKVASVSRRNFLFTNIFLYRSKVESTSVKWILKIKTYTVINDLKNKTYTVIKNFKNQN